MKDQNHATTPSRSLSSAANLTSLCVDISPSSSNFFEVLYIGKIKVWQKKVPDTFIDDALDKFKVHEQEKSKQKLGNLERIRRGSTDSGTSETGSVESLSLSQKITKSDDPEPATESNEAKEQEKDLKTPDFDDHNRTMVLQVDRTDLRLISPDRKVILLHKHHRDITTCVQGQVQTEHFGFISREGANMQTFTGYIFKCESQSIANDAVQAITQAFLNAESRPRPALSSCEHCPMVWFHKLCTEVEHMSDRKTQAAILRRLEQLDEEEQTTILTKFRGAETDSVREQNEFLMMLLRAHCEMKQGRHMHDTVENRSEFLNQYLGGSTIFTKAKRSLTSSFEMLKRKASKDDFGPSMKDMNLPVSRNFMKEASPNDISDKESEGTRSRSSTIGSQSDLNHLTINKDNQKASVSPDKQLKSPMMDIFLKVGNSPRSTSSDDGSPNKPDGGSWRQAIFKTVVTPSKKEEVKDPPKKKTKEELRALWRKSIHQAILLVRMEKENARLRAEQEESAVKRIKLEYDEMKPNQREIMEVWDMLTNKESRIKCDSQMLLQAIRQGVPRGKRGEVWQLLAEQFCSKVPPIDLYKYPNYNVPYETLLKQLTSHQHAILIDLGRTFPNHSYFSSPLGPGQLALFNLLKAYSLLDPEVGYCQGLSFVAGVLLLHMEESQAFFLLRHLMFRRGLRKQYLPDMIGLQIKLYQLSRLLHDQLPDLYNHFDFYEVAPTLYAAPWLLTVFASQFPLGFVTRVFDLLFLENPDVIFRVALSLLSYHKQKLLQCDSFEEIMNYLKMQLPQIDKPMLDKIMKQVYTTDIRKQLDEYKVEYQVLQEEMTSVQPQVDALHKLEKQNKTLTDQNKALMSQLELALSNVQRLEKQRVLQQAHINKLEMQSRGLEVTIGTLGNFINGLIEAKVDVEIPSDVRRIMSQLTFSEQQDKLRTFQRDSSMVKSLSAGKIHVNNNTEDGMTRSNSLNSKALQVDKPKTSHFFSTSHSNILQNMNNLRSNSKIDITVEDFEKENNARNNEKSTSLPLTDYGTKMTPSHSIDSGVGTPSTPNHPLSNCDVNFTYNGTRELKNIKSLRNMVRTSSPDLLGK
ncbi:TBC1 domain family member 1 isoform X2 [Aethina tumida]|nr:TBC1 domain family member 1 isoform X2 [Aethina tumida]